MEKNNNINIAEILRDCPKGTKLYSPLFGEVKLNETLENKVSILSTGNEGREYFDSFSKNRSYYPKYSQSECLLFPSSEMRDWSKFFKRGDVVWCEDDMYAIFEGWANDDYTKFNTTIDFHVFGASFDKEVVCDTDRFVKASDEERAVFIANAERTLKGKYNPDTLQVEPVKPKCPFKPFDKVLVRDTDEQAWCANYFSHYKNDPGYFYVCVNGIYHYCIPLQRAYRPPPRHNRPLHGRRQQMSCPFSLENVKFRETAHIAFEDEYVTAYQSTDIVPKIYKSVNTPRDKSGLASGKPKTYYRTRYSDWVTEKTFIAQYQKIREKF